MKKADIPLFSNVSDTTKVITLSLPSFSIHSQETSVVPLPPSHCTCKESSADSESSPRQESNVSFNAHSTDSCLSDSSTGEGDDQRGGALRLAWLGQVDRGME